MLIATHHGTQSADRAAGFTRLLSGLQRQDPVEVVNALTLDQIDEIPDATDRLRQIFAEGIVLPTRS